MPVMTLRDRECSAQCCQMAFVVDADDAKGSRNDDGDETPGMLYVALDVLRRIRGFTTMRYIRFTYFLTYLLTLLLLVFLLYFVLLL